MFQEKADQIDYRTSHLGPDAIRWANKRKSNNSNSVKAYLFPPLALQIHLLLNRLEAEFAGNKRVAELYEAVTTVVEFYNPRHKFTAEAEETHDLVHNQGAQAHTAESDFLNGYVGADRSGGKEFAEFLAQTSDTSGGDIQLLEMRKIRLQVAFDDLCKHLRRRDINHRLDASHSDTEKFNTMVDLFAINYFKTNSFEAKITRQNLERGKKYPESVKNNPAGLRNYKLENSIGLQVERRKEMSRLQSALTGLDEKSRVRVDAGYRKKEIGFWEERGGVLPVRKRK
mmetsp:Transcript_22088/g.49102  ORF Transcript_22088/g.49102 Transcript_22088/m.49102 type:complete len:285 (-) Transcript_22088:400-1254(-)